MGKPRCQVCGSRQWHKEPTSGLIACSEGHILQNYRTETVDTGNDLGTHALTKRKLKSNRKSKGSQSRTNPELYHGLQGRLLYFRCLQIILRHQAQYLMKSWSLPADYETTCREIWALHLSSLSEPIPHEDDISSTQNDPLEQNTNRDSPDLENHVNTATEEPDPDPELEDLMRENSVLSSSSSDSEYEETHPSVKTSSRSRGIDQSETPASTIAILVVACWVLRVPVMHRDFISLIDSYALPYLSLLKYIPSDLRYHLSKYTKASLQPLHPPRMIVLHGIVSKLCQNLQKNYSVVVPELNTGPILWRVVKYMAGTPTLYVLARRLAQVLDLPLTLHQSLVPDMQQGSNPISAKFRSDNVAPELSLLATLIMVLKMVYGLDGRPRVPTDEGDPACSLPDFASYIHTLKKLEGMECMEENKICTSEPVNVTRLSNEVLDKYLDFCHDALAVEESPRVLHNYFPLRSTSGNMQGAEISSFATSLDLHPGNVASANDGGEIGPGNEYPIYKAQDILGVLTEEYSMIITRGAKWLGVTVEDLNAVIESYERRLERWWRSQKK